MARIARVIRRIKFREKLRGHPWQERFTSFTMDDRHLLAAAHLAGRDDQLVKVEPLLDIVSDRRRFLTLTDEDELVLSKKHERSGRPLGEISFIEGLEADLKRLLRPAKRGPKPKRA